MVGAWIALDARHEIEATMRDAFNSETIDEVFKLSLAGGSTGVEAMTRLLRESTGDKSFDDLSLIPFVAMTVDLNAQSPAPVTEGPLWEALSPQPPLPECSAAGTGRKRLVDGLARPRADRRGCRARRRRDGRRQHHQPPDARRVAGRGSRRRADAGRPPRVCSTPCSR